MMHNKYTKACFDKDPSLPEGWEPYLYECLPKFKSGDHNWKATHIRLIGSVPRLYKKGKYKGEKCWNEKVHEREFIFTLDEVEAFSDDKVNFSTENPKDLNEEKFARLWEKLTSPKII